MIDRRGFLKVAAGAPIVFGLREFLLQDAADARPEWFKRALAWMKERKIPGIVIVTPAAPEREEGCALGAQLIELIDGDYPEVHELFLGAAFILLRPSLAQSCGIVKPEDKENRILLDPEGKRIAADAIEVRVFETPAAFVASFAPFIYGDRDARLKARAEELAAAAPADVSANLGRLGGSEIEVKDEADKALLERAREYHPLYAYRRRTASDSEVAARLKSILERHYRSFEADKTGPRLPFGTRIPKFVDGGCGGQRELLEDEKESRSHVACGMSAVREEKVVRFLRFLKK